MITKTTFLSYLFPVLLTGVIGCSEPVKEPSGKPLVFVSIPPQAGLAKAIAGDRVDVRTLVGPGQSPHAYEPTPRQMTALASARQLLTIGVPFEQHLLRKLRSIHPELKIIETQAGIPMRTMTEAHTCTAHDHHHNHHHETSDPHVWLSPGNAQQIASNLCEALCQTAPEHEAYFRRNLTLLNQQLEAVDREISAALKPFAGETFYVFHPSFGYFGDAYGLKQKAIETDGKDPSPRQLTQLIEQARQDQVHIIFVQKQFSSRSAETIAKAVGAIIVEVDPLAENLPENLRHLAAKIQESFHYE